MRASRFTSAIAFAFALTALTVSAAEAGTYANNKCVADKLKAMSSNCKAVFKAWGNYVGGGGLDAVKRDDGLAKAALKLDTAWTKAEDKAAAKGADCADTTLDRPGMEAIINGELDAIVNDVLTGLTLSNGDDAKCGSALIKAAGDKCAALLKNEGGYIQKLEKGKSKRDAGNTKANDKFTAKVNDALVGCPTAATLASIDANVTDLTSGTITNSIISPNVSTAEFDTISPPYAPGFLYDGRTYNPICSEDTPYHFFVKRGTVNKLVMYYQGGGACWNTITCGIVGTFDKNVDPMGTDNPDNVSTGFADLSNPNNPFKDWHIVFVSYCTGDIHFGDQLNLYPGGYPIFHNGYQNSRVVEKFAREHFVNPEEVFVTGSSAGAYGAFFNAPLHHFVWPDSKFTVLGDAGNGIITPEFLDERFPIWNFEANLPTNIPGIQEAIDDGTGIPAYTAAVATFFPNTAWAHYTSSYDGGTGGQTGFYNVMINDTDVVAEALAEWPTWWEASCEWNDLMRQQAADTYAAIQPANDNYRYYIGTGSRHTMYGSNKVYTDTSGGVPTIVDWINDMLARDIGWTNVECSSDCGKLLPGDPIADTVCAGGSNDQAPCNTASQCPGGACELADPFEQVGPDVVITCP